MREALAAGGQSSCAPTACPIVLCAARSPIELSACQQYVCNQYLRRVALGWTDSYYLEPNPNVLPYEYCADCEEKVLAPAPQPESPAYGVLDATIAGQRHSPAALGAVN